MPLSPVDLYHPKYGKTSVGGFKPGQTGASVGGKQLTEEEFQKQELERFRNAGYGDQPAAAALPPPVPTAPGVPAPTATEGEPVPQMHQQALAGLDSMSEGFQPISGPSSRSSPLGVRVTPKQNPALAALGRIF